LWLNHQTNRHSQQYEHKLNKTRRTTTTTKKKEGEYSIVAVVVAEVVGLFLKGVK